MAFSMIGAGIQQVTQTMAQQVKQAVAQVGQTAGEVRDRVELGGTEPAPWRPFPQANGMGSAQPTAPKLQTMEQADEAAAAAIDQMVQLSGSRQPMPSGGGGQITNFNTQALDQQLMISDMRAAQAIQRQTQLAGGGVVKNPKTQAALARLGDRALGAFCKQAAAQQKGTDKPTTQPSPKGLTWM